MMEAVVFGCNPFQDVSRGVVLEDDHIAHAVHTQLLAEHVVCLNLHRDVGSLNQRGCPDQLKVIRLLAGHCHRLAAHVSENAVLQHSFGILADDTVLPPL
eukprot:7434536-Lingulodinium_polyedra.AAC.1